MTITITHLSWREKITPAVGPWPEVPYLIANVTWRVTPDGDDDIHTLKSFLSATEDYSEVPTIDDSAKFEAFVESNGVIDVFRNYPGIEKRSIFNDKKWHYLEKFNTFWAREWVVDCTVTRAVLQELEIYQKLGKFPSVYRGVDSHIIYQHIDTLQRYWD